MKLLFLSGLAVIFWVSIINMFPSGYVFSGNDVVQFINLKSNYGNLFYVWNHMAGAGGFLQYFSYSIFYYPFYLLSLLSVGASAQSFLYFFIFLSSSYVCFFLASKAFLGTKFSGAFELRVLMSLIYALNPYTLYVFTYTWGYSPFLLLYPLIPLIFALVYSYVSNQKIFSRKLGALGVVFFISNIAFGNFSFYVSLILSLLAFIVLLYIFRLSAGKVILKALLVFLMFFAATFWIFITDLVGMIYTYNSMMGSGAFDLGGWILYQRLPVLPQVFLYPNLDYFVGTFPLLFALGAVGLLGLLVVSLRKIRKLSGVFLVLAAMSIFITSKGAGLLSDSMVLKIFTLPVLNTLRSFDKTFIFLPFFLFIIIFLGIQEFYSKPSAVKAFSFGKLNFRFSHRRIVLAGFLLVLVGVAPFFAGGIQTKYSYVIDAGTNYQTSTYSYLVKIPSDYYNASAVISQDTRQNKILDLPYSVINSVGWVNYPAWKVVSADPTDQLFSKPSVQANSADFYQYGQIWNGEACENASWIISMMSLYNVQYLIYHKDVAQQFFNQTVDKISFLQNQSYINLVENYPNFDLYSLNSTYYRPLIYPTTTANLINGSNTQLAYALKSGNLTDNNIFFLTYQISEQQLQLIKNYNQTLAAVQNQTSPATPNIIFQQNSPVQYQVKVENASSPFFLVFSETYDPWWKAYVANSETSFGGVTATYLKMGVQEAKSAATQPSNSMGFLLEKPLPENTHYGVNGYGNAWLIDPSAIAKNPDGSFQITLYYTPQSYYNLGWVISTVALAACIISLIIQTTLLRTGFSFKKRGKTSI
jgi:hypothetical protein